MGQSRSKSQKEDKTNQDSHDEKHPAPFPIASGHCYLGADGVPKNVAYHIGYYLPRNSRHTLGMTSKFNRKIHQPNINKINQILVARRFEQPDVYPLTPYDQDLIETLKELCQAIIAYNKAWLAEYEKFKASNYETWHQSALSTSKIDELIKLIPKPVITNNRIGIALAKMAYAAAYRDMRINSKMNLSLLDMLAKMIVNAQRNTPESVLDDYFRGVNMSSQASRRNDYNWAGNLSVGVFSNYWFLVIRDDSHVCYIDEPFRWGLEPATMSNSLSLVEVCIEKLNCVLKPELTVGEINPSQNSI